MILLNSRLNYTYSIIYLYIMYYKYAFSIVNILQHFSQHEYVVVILINTINLNMFNNQLLLLGKYYLFS